MAILTSTVDGTVNHTAGDFYMDVVHIGALVERGALVTLTCTIEETGDGVGFNDRLGTRHTDGTAAHRHMAVAHHIGILASAIYTG